jgi:hypothetical protein
MRLVINLVLVAIVAFLVYALYSSIREPIAFKTEKERRERQVIDKLMKIRTAQEAFRDITGKFAADFDTLAEVLETGNFKIIKVIGDPDDPDFTGDITYDTVYQSAGDSMRKVLSMNNFDSLRYIPFTRGGTFDISANVIDYQSTEVPVVEVGTPRSTFMGPYADPRFARYDQGYDPSEPLKFGNLYAPNLSGNWE